MKGDLSAFIDLGDMRPYGTITEDANEKGTYMVSLDYPIRWEDGELGREMGLKEYELEYLQPVEEAERLEGKASNLHTNFFNIGDVVALTGAEWRDAGVAFGTVTEILSPETATIIGDDNEPGEIESRKGIIGAPHCPNADWTATVIPNNTDPFSAPDAAEKDYELARELNLAGNQDVNHPDHYTTDPSGIECIQITRHRNFNVGNAIKYLWRAGLKDESATVQDLQKAVWYIRDEIERIENQ